jgi:hypothetical protein
VSSLGPPSDRLKLASRIYFSGIHRLTAARFAHEAYELDQRGNPTYDAGIIDQQLTNVSAVVVFSAAYLEASINEVYADAADDPPGSVAGSLKKEEREQLGRLWTEGTTRTGSCPILTKYETALEALGRPHIDKSRPLYASTKVMVRLRNAIVHAEPEWDEYTVGVPSRAEEWLKLERDLKYKFEENGLVGDISPFFPLRALGYGCAKWALQSAEQFITEFLGIVGIPGSVYGALRPPLALK